MKRSLKRGLVVLCLFAGIFCVGSGAWADTISSNHVVVGSGGP